VVITLLFCAGIYSDLRGRTVEDLVAKANRFRAMDGTVSGVHSLGNISRVNCGQPQTNPRDFRLRSDRQKISGSIFVPAEASAPAIDRPSYPSDMVCLA